MSRTAVTMTVLSSAGVADPAGTTINSGLVTAGVNVAVPNTADVGAVPPKLDGYRGIFIRLAATVGTGKNLIIRQGANPPAMRAGLGDLTVALTDSTTTWVGPLEMSRHAQSDDSINIDFTSGTTGTITVFALPRQL